MEMDQEQDDDVIEVSGGDDDDNSNNRPEGLLEEDEGDDEVTEFSYVKEDDPLMDGDEDEEDNDKLEIMEEEDDEVIEVSDGDDDDNNSNNRGEGLEEDDEVTEFSYTKEDDHDPLMDGDEEEEDDEVIDVPDDSNSSIPARNGNIDNDNNTEEGEGNDEQDDGENNHDDNSRSRSPREGDSEENSNSNTSEPETGESSSNNNNNNSQKPILVLIDTKSILSGKGPVPMNTKSSGSSGIAGSNQVNCIKPMKKSDILLAPPRNPGGNSAIKIPDDAFLIEAPSFIVPYVFEQNGEKALKEYLKELKVEIKKEKQEAAIANGEPEPSLDEDEDTSEPTKPKAPSKPEDYFESPVGKLLVNLGMGLVQEFVQVDLLKMQKRKADKERSKNRSGTVSIQTQQSIISLKNNVEESKENNEPFHHPLKKCRQCNFRTESELVMNAHLETPHMRHGYYRCNFCKEMTKLPHEILMHMEMEHKIRPRLERAAANHQCINCPYEDNSKAKITRHLIGCVKRFQMGRNLEPPTDWDTPAKLPKMPKNRLIAQGNFAGGAGYLNQQVPMQGGQGRNVIVQYPTMKMSAGTYVQQGTRSMNLPPLLQAPKTKPLPGLIRTNPSTIQQVSRMNNNLQKGMMMRNAGHGSINSHIAGNQLLQQNASLIRNTGKSQPSISITPLPRHNATGNSTAQAKQQGGKTSFVICEICDGYIKDLDQLRNHMQWIHKVKIHPKMIYNKPPLNCQKCQFRFFTDQGLERHLLGSHGLVTSSMQEAANKGQDNGRCPLCGKVYQWKLLAHVAKDHNVTLKPAHLSYKCTVCTATFGMYKLFESHVYSAHSMNSKRNNNIGGGGNTVAAHSQGAIGGRQQQMSALHGQQQMINQRLSGSQVQMKAMNMSGSASGQNSYKPLKINDEITIIPQPIANAAPLRSRGSLTITPHTAPINRSRQMRANGEDGGGIEIIEIDDGLSRLNGRKENGEFRGQLPISASALRKRNLEISVCDSDGSDDSFHRSGPPQKRLRGN